MKPAIKSLILASCVAGLSTMLSACSSTGKIDYDDSVETPDVLLEDASGGDSDYSLDKNAARNNQQNKPDGLVQSTNSRSSDGAQAKSRDNQSDSRSQSRSKAQTVQAETAETKAPEQRQQVAKTRPVKKTKPAKPKKEPSKQESALEVDDPLLGEIDPQ